MQLFSQHLHFVIGDIFPALDAASLYRYFETITDFNEIDDGETHILLCHYPIIYRKRGYMIHGHIHQSRGQEYQLLKELPRVLNAGVDINFYRPVTLEELEALSALEPYGSGNARPVFCLLGATLLRTQNVGQNRHLKLLFSKGASQLEGIFFSVTPQQCPVRPGERVDVAFYLQINEFRGSRTVQLQVVDLRPSLQCSAREEESLLLLRRLEQGESLSAKEALRLLPSRQQCVAPHFPLMLSSSAAQ